MEKIGIEVVVSFVKLCDLICWFEVYYVDVVLFDYMFGFGEIDGFNFVKFVNMCFLDCWILMMLSSDILVIVSMMMCVGVFGFFGKSEDFGEFVYVICVVVNGCLYISVELVVWMELSVMFDLWMVDMKVVGGDGMLIFELGLLVDLCFSLCEYEVLCCFFVGMFVFDIVLKFFCSFKMISV